MRTKPERNLVPIPFAPATLTLLANAAQPIGQRIEELITGFILCLYSTAANSVFLGGPNVLPTNGIEILPGSGPISFEWEDVRQLYELQYPLNALEECTKGEVVRPDVIPLIVFDPSQIFLIAAANTNINVTLIKSPYA